MIDCDELNMERQSSDISNHKSIIFILKQGKCVIWEKYTIKKSSFKKVVNGWFTILPQPCYRV